MQPRATWMTDEHLIALGRVVVHAGRLEYFIREFASMLADPTDLEMGPAITAGMPFDRLCGLIDDALPRRESIGEEAVVEWRATRPVVLAAMRTRNELLHSRWWPDGSSVEQPSRSQRLRKGGALRIEADVDAATISKAADEIAEAEASAQSVFHYVAFHMNLIDHL